MPKPDLSGEWHLNKAASTLSPGADTVTSAVYWIDHRDPAFRQKARYVFPNDTREFDFELRADGRDVTAPDAGGETTSNVHWDGDALVLAFRTRHAAGEVSVVFRYELLDNGRRLRGVEDVRGTDHDQDNVWIFERR